MSARDGGPAFPRPASEDATYGTLADGNSVVREQDGMTLRDYFAGQALTGLLAERSIPAPSVATRAYEYADAMIEAQDGKPRPDPEPLLELLHEIYEHFDNIQDGAPDASYADREAARFCDKIAPVLQRAGRIK